MDIAILDSHGRKLDAKVEVIDQDVIVHSRSGLDRNPDYRPAVETILQNLDAARIGYSVHLDSQPVQAHPLDRRRLSMPSSGSAADRFNALVRAMNAGSASNGAYRRIRFVTTTPQKDLADALAAIGSDASDLNVAPALDSLSLDVSSEATAAGFRDWFNCLVRAARGAGGYHVLPSGIGFRQLAPITDDELRLEFWVGDSQSSAVQINEPSAPGTENPLAGLARDDQNRRYLVRQGVLHKNNVSPRIMAPEFVERSGLTPLNMRVRGAPATRQWHLVTPLDGLPDDTIVQNTEDFVARCWRARTGRRNTLNAERLPTTELRKVTSVHVDHAIATLLGGGDAPNFAESRDYDVLAPGNVRLPPKKVFGLALEQALGIEAFPSHFSAGHGNPCFTIIEAAGYPIIPKTEPTPAQDDAVDPDFAAAEGNLKLVKHFKRERKPALAAAKRRSMIAELGYLICERCQLAPSHTLGPHGDAVIEVHHAKVQVSEMAKGHVTRLDDLQCLCANCHRIVHREIAS